VDSWTRKYHLIPLCALSFPHANKIEVAAAFGCSIIHIHYDTSTGTAAFGDSHPTGTCLTSDLPLLLDVRLLRSIDPTATHVTHPELTTRCGLPFRRGTDHIEDLHIVNDRSEAIDEHALGKERLQIQVCVRSWAIPTAASFSVGKSFL
jgi:hypothetical protein